jgi:hypothetical protein
MAELRRLGGRDLSALAIIKEAADFGVLVNLNGDSLALEAATERCHNPGPRLRPGNTGRMD